MLNSLHAAQSSGASRAYPLIPMSDDAITPLILPPTFSPFSSVFPSFFSTPFSNYSFDAV